MKVREMAQLLTPDAEEELEGRQERFEHVQVSALAILNQSEHAAMVQTANLPANRRSLDKFDKKLKEYATFNQSIALSMFYSLPRAGKQIIGPSVRFAEIVAPCWRNCAVGSRVIGDSSNSVTGQGIFLDYELDYRNSIEVPRRITDKNGQRYSDDMVITTANAAMSVARRNAILKGGVPQALWTPAYEEAQDAAVGKGISHQNRVANAMEYLHKKGVTEWMILNSVGVASPKELETDHLLTLRVLCDEIKRGDKTIEEVFGSPYDKEIDRLFAELKMNQAQQTMLKNSYMGRAKELAEYLRERTQPVRQATEQVVVRVPIVAAEATAAAPEPEVAVANENDRKSNPEEPKTVIPETPVKAIPDDNPADTAGEGGTGFAFGANAPETQAPAMADYSPFAQEQPPAKHQTSMEPPPKKRVAKKQQPAPQSEQGEFEL